ncbi:MAG: TIGR03936 family radical SAM-associated protein [Propionibacteriaceae bacterium]|nr:TIGR03936 family radical SAM-associated protein [Propionibacteriaceae bacterium]
MARRQPSVQQAPPAQRLRICYARRGPARFTSHRDFGRVLERALRRAGVPMAYSSGFSPRPRISYANAAPTAAASEAEYAELGLKEVCDPVKVVAALNRVLPSGFEVLGAAVAGRASLGELLQASDWEAAVGDCDRAVLSAAVHRLLDSPEALVERMTKSGKRVFDTRAAVLDLTAPADGLVRIRMKHLTPLVRPDDVITVLRRLEPAIPVQAVLLTRLRQGPLTQDGIGDPFTGERVEQ